MESRSTVKEFSILIVDDEKTNIDILNEILKEDYRLLVAKSGQDAIRRAQMSKPDLILMDIIMPDMNGFQVLSALKGNPLTVNIPIIFITGLNSVEDEERGFLLGAVDYIVKPFNNNIVKARVNTHLQIIKQMRTIEKLGLIDTLTNLPNRRSYENHLSTSWANAITRKAPISMIMVDADDFKVYNDTYGHPQGDILLKALGNILASVNQYPNSIAARIGGDEFALLLPDISLVDASTIAGRMRLQIQNTSIPYRKDNIETCFTVSMGVSSAYPNDETSRSKFFDRADSMLYVAKANGKNQVRF